MQVILSPMEAIADTYRALLPDGSGSDFQRILDLKVGDCAVLCSKLEYYSTINFLDLNFHSSMTTTFLLLSVYFTMYWRNHICWKVGSL
jgi:hypothetical protein